MQFLSYVLCHLQARPLQLCLCFTFKIIIARQIVSVDTCTIKQKCLQNLGNQAFIKPIKI